MNNRSRLPDRVKDNWMRDEPEESYALYKSYPSSVKALRANIESAFRARTAKANKAKNRRVLRQRNSSCP